MVMLRNWVKIALRSLRRQKGYTLLNMLGLTAGLTCFFLIGLFVLHEHSYDRFHDDADRIVRVVEVYREGGQIVETSASVPLPFGPTLANAAGVQAVRLYRPFQETPLVRYEDRAFYESDFLFVDSTFFDVFDFELVQGNPATALDAPLSVVLTESTARKYFGDRNAVGQTLEFENALDLLVTGVAEDPPPNSHVHFDFLASLQRVGDIVATAGNPALDEAWQGWFWNPAHTYVRLPEGRTMEDLEATLPGFVQTHFPVDVRDNVSYYLQPMTDIHLTSDLYQEIGTNGSARLVRIFALIGLFILVIAGINFVNLSTARSIRRAKEVGMRKVLGAEQKTLVWQFLSEPILLTLVAALVAALLALLLLPVFGNLLGATLPRSLWLHPAFLLTLPLVVLVVGILAGLYPAFVLSSFDPIGTLKGKGSEHSVAAAWLRKGLVVAQFAISILLLISTFVVYQQFQFMREQNLGFDQEQIVMIPTRGTTLTESAEAFKDELKRRPSVRTASFVSDVVGRDVAVHNVSFEGVEDLVPTAGIFTDLDFVETFGVEVVEGDGFDPEQKASQQGCLLNQAIVRQLGWDGQALSRTMTRNEWPVLGITEDFHFTPLREGVRPLVMCTMPALSNYVAVRVAPGNAEQTLADLEGVWSRFEPDRPFEAFFLDDNLDQLYRAEARLGQTVGVFTLLAGLIACLGLLGLAAYTAEQRRKEIGVRKVLGASVASLVMMLSTDFLLLIGAAFVISVPIAYVAMRRWLDSFAYTIPLSWWIFALAGIATLVVAWLTISYQSFRAATSDPVKVLRESNE